MKKYIVSLLALLAMGAFVLVAADIDGTWTAETQGKNGKQMQTLTLMSKGGALMGKMDGGRGGAIDISDGKVDGNNVTFKVVRDFQGKQFTQEFKGMLKGGELMLETQGRGGAVQMNFKKK